ncbi:MAG: hypothetical protein GEV28_06335 [Actinophytocola sp.]|uniref:hypothetical protein n=1 Tax=Actinophytocola sp. TaxID=1872138 RepID=UPI00132986CB|nr:hypothetical protein [Actinophytocola sp.]MPZ80025.1 hypothetical protein [Actinophytocola sp.]
MRVIVSLSGVVRLVALGFALGIVVGLYFGIGGRADPGAAECGPGRPGTEQCAPAPTPTDVAPPAELVIAP